MSRAEAADLPPTTRGHSRSESIQLSWRRLQRSPVVPVTLAAIVALTIGILIGRAFAPTVDDTAVAVVNREVVSLAVDADALWTAGSSGLPAVSDQLQQLRTSGDPEVVTPYVEGWLDAYDAVLRRLVGVEVPPSVRPVQRQFVTAVTLTRDAVELLGSAAEADEPAVMRDLTSEVLRLRIRAEEFTQTAQAGLNELEGATTGGVAEPSRLPSLVDLR